MSTTEDSRRLVLLQPRGSLEMQKYDPVKPYPSAIQVRNHATSLNHLDWKRIRGNFLIPGFPHVLGMDIAGIISDPGTSLRFSSGDRVMAPGVPGWGDASSFQTHVIVKEPFLSKIPDGISFAEASTIPFCLMTAACGLFVTMGLSINQEDQKDEHRSEVILIWGANGNVGSLAIQLAKIAKYRVIAVTSTRAGVLRAEKLGADLAFSNDDPRLISHIAGASTPPTAALDTVVSHETITRIAQCVSSGKIVTAQKYTGEEVVGTNLISVYSGEMFGKTTTGGVSQRGLEVSTWLWGNLHDWLQSSQITPLSHDVIGGLQDVERGLERMAKGDSKTKLVVNI